MLPWLKNVFGDVECCTMRSGPDAPARPAFPAPTPQPHRHRDLHHDHHLDHDLPDKFFLKLAESCCNDHQIAARIDDDRTSQLIWGEAHSIKKIFIQMCIRDRYDRCRDFWRKLHEYERRELMQVAHHGPPSKDFWMDIMVHHEQAWSEISDCSASSCGRSVSSYPSVSSIVDEARSALSWD